MRYVKIIISTALIILMTFSIRVDAKDISYGTSIYMWEVENINYSLYKKIVDELHINKIYAYIGTAHLNTSIDYEENLLFEFAKNNNISTYLVYDENYEDQTENKNRIKEFIDEINEYNETSDYKIKGLTIDSEFHSLPIYSTLSNSQKIELFNNYVNAMIEAREYANQFNLEFVVCIPVWLNSLDISLLDKLIKDGSDYVQLMNYAKNNMVNNIAEEIQIAKIYNKPIENIAEFQIPGPHDVSDDITFYNDGIDACNNKFREIDSTYNYDLLTFSYHYYKPISELFNNTNLYSNLYEYELYPKDYNNDSLNVKDVYLINNTNKIKGLYIYNESSNEYIIHFYGLEYNKNYDLIIDDNKYELINSKTINYTNSSTKIFYDEAQFKEKKIINNTELTNEENNDNNNDIGNITEENSNTNIEEKIPEVSNPKTGSNIIIYIFLYIISILGCISLSIYNFKNIKNRC